jgi:4-phytase/acid phosphatase
MPGMPILDHALAPEADHPAVKRLLALPASSVMNPTGDPIVSNTGPLSTAGELTEDILLEYVDDKPLADVGWGNIGEHDLDKLLPIRTSAFSLSHRTVLFARAESSNLLFHILQTLVQAATQSVIPGAIGPVGTRVVYVSGHDTNLFGIGGLLHLHWSSGDFFDATPPDSQLDFELWSAPGSRQYTIRIDYRAQTLEQLRNLSQLTPLNPPTISHLDPTGCDAGQTCPLKQFLQSARKSIDNQYVHRVVNRSHTIR